MHSPAHVVRIGNISGTIWDNSSQSGTWYSTEIVRNYKEKDEWQKAANFRLSDLPVVAKVAELCLQWIMAQHDDSAAV